MIAPKYIPANIMRKMTRNQLMVIATQKNTKGTHSTNANNAQKILWYDKNRLHYMVGTLVPLSKASKGWQIATEETVDITSWLNGTENLKLLEADNSDN